jgi:hypothetical protein
MTLMMTMMMIIIRRRRKRRRRRRNKKNGSNIIIIIIIIIFRLNVFSPRQITTIYSRTTGITVMQVVYGRSVIKTEA